MICRKVSWFCCACFLWATSAVLAAGQTPAVPAARSSRLHVDGGVIDTTKLPNLLSQPRAAADTGKAYVVQLDDTITPMKRAALEAAGVSLSDYLPDNAYIVDLAGDTISRLPALGFVSWAGEYQDDWKISSEIGARLSPFQTEERINLEAQAKVKLVVTLFEGRDATLAIANLAELGGTVLGHDMSGRHVEIFMTADANDLDKYARVASVQFIEEAPEITLRNDTTRWIIQSNTFDVTPVYDNGIHGEDQIVGVLDGRADQDHCSLDDGKILFYNASDGNDVHGTHVSCTAVGDNGVDDNLRGMAYLGHMVYNTTPAFTEAGITQRLDLHHSQGARVHTNSWGDDGTTSYNSLARGFDVFLYDNEDDLVCLAVTNTSSLRNPENAKNLLAVGASQDTPNQANHCSGGTGPTADGRRKPEIYAPGCSTISATPSACSTTALTGTSMASPAIAGVGALVRQYYFDGYYPSGAPVPADAFTPSGALVKATLLNSAVDMTGVSGYPSNTEGWGRALVDASLMFPGDARKLGVLADIRNADGLSTGEFLEFNVNVLSNSEKLKITLVWVDPPASASTGTGSAAINNLDLEVESPSATLFRGNVFASGVSTTGGSADDRNNVEQVHVNSPAAGSWTVRVKATAVNQNLQGFALVATGDIQLAPPDCNGNEVPDEDDISGGTSEDCDGNGIPDECQPDCDNSGTIDACESWPDCNVNGIPDQCDIGDISGDCNTNGVPDECEEDCNNNGTIDDCESWPDCNNNGTPDECDLDAGAPDCNHNDIPDECEGLPDCNANNIPDECEALPDCNDNNVLDACEIAAGSATDCDNDFVLDACEPDCNNNGIADDCDLNGGGSSDCNENGIPDECDPDCDADGVPDACEPVNYIFTDNFETDLGWTVTSEPGTSGVWERADPVGTSLGGQPLQPEDDNPAGTGTLCYVTGAAGGLPNANDVDGGPTRLTSPAITSASSVVTISYAYWLWSGLGSGNDDVLTVEASNNDGASWTTVAVHDVSDTVWQYASVDLHDHLTTVGQLRIRYSIDDTNGTSFTEAAVDDVMVSAVDCTFVDCNSNGTNDQAELQSGSATDCNGNGTLDECDTVGDFNGDGFANAGDMTAYTDCLTGPCASVPCAPAMYGDACCAPLDWDDDGDVDLQDFAAVQMVLTGP
ncbi:MAG: S8 family serine peptidase [Phycisphaerales bacterium]|nr:S8 family serine peptidase [Phycisphaerales bacterium]